MKNHQLLLRTFALCSALPFTLTLARTPTTAAAPGAGPRVGVNGDVLESIALTGDAGGEAARSLRMRRVTIDPGGLLPFHSHAERPSVSYVLSGTVTETFEDTGESRRLTAG